MDPDDAADVVEELSPPEAEGILFRMAPDEAAQIRDLASFAPDSAGGLMTPDFVAITPEAKAADAISAIRRLVDEAETVNYVYVMDDERHLLGVLSLYRLLLSPADTPVRELMAPNTVRVRASADRETAARLLTERNLLAIPVVDSEDRLLGIITEDDVADIIEAEATEDIERLGGSQPLNVPYRLASVPLLVRKRVGWLMLLFFAEGYTGTVLQNFQGELTAVVALSFFIPLLIGTGGNIGSQTVTLVVRAMALNEVALRDIGWLVFKELRVGLAIGLFMAVVGVAQAIFLNVSGDIALVVALALIVDLRLVSKRGFRTASAAAPSRGRSSRRFRTADHDPRRWHGPDHLLRDRPARPAPLDPAGPLEVDKSDEGDGSDGGGDDPET